MKKNKKILWVRELYCGHSRATNIAYMCQDYTKPLVGEKCFCRDCSDNSMVLEVRESSKKELKELNELINTLKDN